MTVIYTAKRCRAYAKHRLIIYQAIDFLRITPPVGFEDLRCMIHDFV